MSEPIAKTPAAALRRYRATVSASAPIAAVAGSLINQTWSVGKPPRFTLQLVAAQFDDDVNRRIDIVGARLKSCNVGAPILVRTDDEALSIAAPSARRWRLLTWVPGRIYHRMPSPAHAAAAASLVARFHDALGNWPDGRTLPAGELHDTRARMAALSAALGQVQGHELEAEIEPLGRELLGIWERWRGTGAAPTERRPGHGDLKVSNLVFDADGADALALIDFDTLGRYSLDEELGDALRSWCSSDDENAPRPSFDEALFEAVIAGYLGASRTIDRPERASLVFGLGRITLELAARFLTDAVAGAYFAWDPAIAPTRAQHNLLRAKNQLELARQVVQRRRRLESIVQRY